MITRLINLGFISVKVIIIFRKMTVFMIFGGLRGDTEYVWKFHRNARLIAHKHYLDIARSSAGQSHEGVSYSRISQSIINVEAVANIILETQQW